ncbi:carbon-phosphorus lyase complex subunit PhnI [Rhizobium miluonense]|uniref:Alpha-D-ribose 1-methylphosphonate 5-triphosphate synthase subunit PhnI n=1 Tax=Rhizobium miluonense TaxID=411945 RepID=A0A1C3WEV9_9HYPH|nr:carbon-phosphorus lyase complex subunit PhnI [Rhizobium miluonense]SCB38234.1 alpha-D-ribose 1-methylphosphonate 5-triphosphate synthase subunit PhnI [Rhizobium miluonense]
MVTSIKGGEKAIDASHRIVSKRRRGDPTVANLSVEQVREQLSLAVDRVMNEGSLYDPTLAALAIKQAEGDLIEAIYLLRAYRSTIPRFGFTKPLDTAAMLVRRRISTTHKDVPGGQYLGPTYDYTHRLLDFSLMRKGEDADGLPVEVEPDEATLTLRHDGGFFSRTDIIEAELPVDDKPVADLTREPMNFPSSRDQRLQNLARGDEGFLMGLCYSTMRGYGRNHPYVGEMRHGDVSVVVEIPELGLEVGIGSVKVTECRTVHLTTGKLDTAPHYTRGYGLLFGHSERKALSVAVVDRALRGGEFGEEKSYPAQDEEFVLSHSDSVQASGLVQHLKLPHYVDFQAEQQLLKQLRDDYDKRAEQAASKEQDHD